MGAEPFRDSAFNGYLTVQDYIDLLQYSQTRSIEVIPSLDMLVHSRAAMKVTEYLFLGLLQEGKIDEAREFLLSDFDDSAHYYSVQFYQDNTTNTCMGSSCRFVEKVFDELVVMREQAGAPLDRYHMCADETAGAWTEPVICEKCIGKQLGLNDA